MIMRVFVMIGSAERFAIFHPPLTHGDRLAHVDSNVPTTLHTHAPHIHTNITHAHAHTQALKIDPAHVNAKKYLGVVMKRLKDQRDLGVDSESPRPVDSPKPEGCTLPSSSFGLAVCSRVCICIWYKLCIRT